MSTGYSGTPLVKKLGIKSGMRIAILHAPENYTDTLGDLSDSITHFDILTSEPETFDFVHGFYAERDVFEAEFPALRDAIRKNGMVWISWIKKASKIPTDLNETIVRNVGLTEGLVDVKVIAIDAKWSGLKFVWRTKDR